MNERVGNREDAPGIAIGGERHSAGRNREGVQVARGVLVVGSIDGAGVGAPLQGVEQGRARTIRRWANRFRPLGRPVIYVHAAVPKADPPRTRTPCTAWD